MKVKKEERHQQSDSPEGWRLGGGDTSVAGVLNAALVSATADPEVSLVAPVGVPRVGHNPVLHTIVNTPAQDLDGMSSEDSARGVLIDSRLVSDKILVDSESTLHRSVLVDLVHDVSLAGDGVSSRALVDHRVPGFTIRASLLASGSGILLAGARVLRVGNVVVARREGVWVAVLSHQTRRSPVSPCHGRISSSAAISAIVAAGQEIVSRNAEVGVDLEGAISVGHGLDRTESPAGTAGRLVADLSNGGAVWPVGAGIEGVRKSRGQLSKSFARKGIIVFEDTHELLNFGACHTLDSAALLSAGSPGSAEAVDVVHHFFVDKGFHVRWHGDNQSQGGGKDQKNQTSHFELRTKYQNR